MSKGPYQITPSQSRALEEYHQMLYRNQQQYEGYDSYMNSLQNQVIYPPDIVVMGQKFSGKTGKKIITPEN